MPNHPTNFDWVMTELAYYSADMPFIPRLFDFDEFLLSKNVLVTLLARGRERDGTVWVDEECILLDSSCEIIWLSGSRIMVFGSPIDSKKP